MLTAIIEGVLYCLAVYGLMSVILNLMKWFGRSDSRYLPAVKVAMFVKNNGDEIEGVFRQLRSAGIRMIHIVDLGSADDTLAIAKALGESGEDIRVMAKEEFDDMLGKSLL